jgi:hypothetical protein
MMGSRIEVLNNHPHNKFVIYEYTSLGIIILVSVAELEPKVHGGCSKCFCDGKAT